MPQPPIVIEINLAFAYLLVFLCLLFTKIVLPYIRVKAFEENSPTHESRRRQRYGFIGISPGFGYRGIHQMLVHTPIFALQLLPFFFVQFPLFLVKCFTYWIGNEHGRFGKEPTDEDILNYAINTPLFILAQVVVDEQGKELLEFKVPSGTHIERQCRGGLGALVAGSCLHMVLDPSNKRIISASVLVNNKANENDDENDGVRVDILTLSNPKQTRNDILMSALHLLVTVWIHPCTHRLAELSAMEIREKGVEILEPSSRFVESLHEGLLHGFLSPASDHDYHPLHTGIYSAQLHQTLASHPVPPHFVSDPRKLKYSESYEFLFKMRGILAKLVKKYGIQVNVEYLFHNIVVHAIDHYIVSKSLSDMNLRVSMNGSCTFRSYVEMFLYKDYWLTPKHNFMEEERTKYIDVAFYKHLYHEASGVNKALADEMITSCSF